MSIRLDCNVLATVLRFLSLEAVAGAAVAVAVVEAAERIRAEGFKSMSRSWTEAVVWLPYLTQSKFAAPCQPRSQASVQSRQTARIQPQFPAHPVAPSQREELQSIRSISA